MPMGIQFRLDIHQYSTVMLWGCLGGAGKFWIVARGAWGRRIADQIIEYIIIVMLMNRLLVGLTNNRAWKDEPLSRGMFGM